MPRLKILGEGGEVVYDGEGELRLTPDPAEGTLGRVSVYQEEVRPTERRCRNIDITEFLRTLQVPYNVHYDAPEIALVWDWDVDPLSVPVPPLPNQVTLSIQYPAGALSWLGNTLRQSHETPDERRARYEAAERRIREQGVTGVMRQIQPDITRLRDAMDNLASLPILSGSVWSAMVQAAEAENLRAQQRAAGGHEVCVRDYEADSVQFSAQDVRDAMNRLRDQYILRDVGDTGPYGSYAGYGIAPRAESGLVQSRPFPDDIWATEPSPFDRLVADEVTDSGSTFHEALERIMARSIEHEAAITSARDAFPHDPYDYGRIYPGDTGTSRWTPPEDPDEKIRSCP